MRQTLFFIPHDAFGLPVFGFGWLLIACLLLSAVLLVWLVRRHGFGAETRSYLPVLLLIAVVIVFLLPRLELKTPDDTPLGLPIRGYGVMLLVGFICGVLIAAYQARRVGVDPDIVYSLSMWLFVGGIVGARVFYVTQYWPGFREASPAETLVEILNFTEGGLVVYGSIIGGFVAFAIFIWKRRLPPLLLADVIAPGMALGLAIGRIGCLLNGCCYGAVAPSDPFAITFPRYASVEQRMLSPPYKHQLESGRLHGIRVRDLGPQGPPVVEHVEQGSPAAAAGLERGTSIRWINGEPVRNTADVMHGMGKAAGANPLIELKSSEGRVYRWELPTHSLLVHPTQIYSSLNAALLFLFLWSYFPFRTRDGQVFAWMMTLYAVTRFLLEMIRDDEQGKFGTPLTISQMISVVTLLLVLAMWVYIAKQPRRPAGAHQDAGALA